MKEFKGLVASNQVKERMLEIPNLVNKATEDLEKISKIPSLVNNLSKDLVKDLETTSGLLSELLEQLKTLKTSYSNLRNEQQKVQLI